MAEPKISYKLNKKIYDEAFNVDFLAEYNLSLQVNNELFRICITDAAKNRCLYLEDYQLQSVNSVEDLLEQLGLIYEDHIVLTAGFWGSVRVAIKNNSFSLIPVPLFEKQYLKEYLSINAAAEKTEDVYYYKQNSLNAINIFAADKRIIDFFNSKYPKKNILYVHHTSPLIEGILVEENKHGRSMYLHAGNNMVTILVKKEKNLEFCNSFHYSNADDFVYFTMFVMDELELNPENTPVTIWGEITPDSIEYKKLYKYIRNIGFGDKPSSLKFGYYFDEVFDHNFFDLYTMHLCE
ncbi:MAG: DUF3822 family protein [Cytophagaceae bacterium]